MIADLGGSSCCKWGKNRGNEGDLWLGIQRISGVEEEMFHVKHRER